MSQPAPPPKIDNLTPASGTPTDASRMTGNRASGQFVYIRVKGSDMLTLEPQFYGKELRDAFLYGKQDVDGHDVYYHTKAIERKMFTIRKVGGTELHYKRHNEFSRRLPKKYETEPPAPPVDWRQVPDSYPKRKFLMKMGQERAAELRQIGFTDKQIDRAARTGKLSDLCLKDENGNPLRKPDKTLLKIPFQVHHCVPLQCGGSNTLDNFALVDDVVHLRLFHRGDDAAVRSFSEGAQEEVALTVPRQGEDIISLFSNVHKVLRKRVA